MSLNPGRRPRRQRVLALSSGGGHWVQLLRLRPALEDCEVVYATVHKSYSAEVGEARFHVIPDGNRSQKLRMAWCAAGILGVLLRVRPDVVISTGAAPGYFALRLARWFGARTIWVDSVANAEELSMSGRLAGPHADLWLTQWEHLAREHGPLYRGSVL